MHPSKATKAIQASTTAIPAASDQLPDAVSQVRAMVAQATLVEIITITSNSKISAREMTMTMTICGEKGVGVDDHRAANTPVHVTLTISSGTLSPFSFSIAFGDLGRVRGWGTFIRMAI